MPSDTYYFLKLATQCLIGIIALVLAISSQYPGWVSSPFAAKSTIMHLSGYSSIQTSADRAIVKIRIDHEGWKQAVVAEEVRSIANDVLDILRPLNTAQNQTDPQAVAAVTDISSSTFETSSWQKDTMLGQSRSHRVKSEMEAEFSDFDALGVVLAKISKFEHLTICCVRWKLSDQRKKDVLFECREAAMNDLLAKFRAFVKPLGLKTIRAVDIKERTDKISDAWSNRNNRYDADYYIQHDELDEGWRGLRRQQLASRAPSYGAIGHDESGEGTVEEAYTMESKALRITATVTGDFEAY